MPNEMNETKFKEKKKENWTNKWKKKVEEEEEEEDDKEGIRLIGLVCDLCKLLPRFDCILLVGLPFC